MRANQHVFSEIPKANVPRSIFNRNHNLKTTIGTDYLYPIYCDEALPGDTFKMKANFFARLTTPTVPIMDSLYLDTFFFAVPVRLVDKEFKRLMGERPFGDVRNDYTTPVLNTGSGVDTGSLSDYLGIPIKVPNLDFVPWWHRAYNLVYNEWFRDENLCPARPIAGLTEEGVQNTEVLSDYVLCRRGKRHDYFTSCLPWPQKGEAVAFSLGQHIKVQNWADNNRGDPPVEAMMSPRWYWYSGTSVGGNRPLHTWSSDSGDVLGTGVHPSVTGTNSQTFLALEAQLDASELVSVNQLREAVAVQHLLEADARGGTRYQELIKAHFGVLSPDARLQRPEYLGGSSTPLDVTSVAQTSGSVSGETPQGNLAAFVTVSDTAFFNKSFTEHTLILGLANVRADLSYQQGLPRMFSRRTKYDFYWPELAHLGEQAVLNKEIYAQGKSVLNADDEPIDDDVFGYQERWAEYRYHPSMITGLFRSTATTPLDYWHLAQKFESLPTLSADFISEHVPIERVLAVQDEPPLILDAWFQLKCARPMPLYSVPGLNRL